VIARHGRKLLVWHFYVVDGRIVASPMQAKLVQLRGLIHPGNGIAAYVAVATDMTDGEEAAGKALRNFLTAMVSPGSYVTSLRSQ
jgi:Protein of unknown function (DUF3485)